MSLWKNGNKGYILWMHILTLNRELPCEINKKGPKEWLISSLWLTLGKTSNIILNNLKSFDFKFSPCSYASVFMRNLANENTDSVLFS